MSISSPFTDGFSPKDTTPQSPSMGTNAGPVPSTPAADYPQNLGLDLPVSVAAEDSPFDEVIVTSINTVRDLNPGGSAPMESPFKDRMGKS